jgi:hypothetical protein
MRLQPLDLVCVNNAVIRCHGSKTMSESAENYQSSVLTILKSMSAYDTGK